MGSRVRFLKAFPLVSVIAAAAAVGAPACTTASKQSGLVLAVTTDLPVPTYVRQVGILVQYADRGRVGQPLHASRYAVRADGTIAIPATLGIGPARSEGDRDLPIRISVVGYRVATSSARAIPSGDTSPPLEAFSIREVQTRIPENDTRLLRMPLEFLDTGSASTTPTPGTGPRSAAGLTPQAAYEVAGVYVNSAEIDRPCRPSDEDETTVTAVGGVCAPAVVDPSHLEAYTGPAQIEGGDAHECFDTGSCFAGAYVVPAAALRATGVGGLDDPHRCIVDLAKIPGLPADTPKERLNLALDTTRTDEGKAVAGIIPLTHALVTANGAPVAKDLAAIDPGFTYGARTLEVPGELCEMLSALPVPYEKRKAATDDRKIERLLVSDRCRAKLAANPACSANTAGWSSAKITSEPASDAGVDSGPIDTGPPPPPACKFKEVARHPIDVKRSAAPVYAGGAAVTWLLEPPRISTGVGAPPPHSGWAVRIGSEFADLPPNSTAVGFVANDRFAAVAYELLGTTYLATFEPALLNGVVRPIASKLPVFALATSPKISPIALGGTHLMLVDYDQLYDADLAAANPQLVQRASIGGPNERLLRCTSPAVGATADFAYCAREGALTLARFPRAEFASGKVEHFPIAALPGPGLPAIKWTLPTVGAPFDDDVFLLHASSAEPLSFVTETVPGAAIEGTPTVSFDPVQRPFSGEALAIVRAKAGLATLWRAADGVDYVAVYARTGVPYFTASAVEIQKNIGVSSNDSEVRVAQVVGTDAVVYALPIPCTP